MDLSHEKRRWMPAFIIPIEVTTMLLLVIRLTSRLRRTGGSPGLDDLFISIAWICASANFACVLLCTPELIYIYYRIGLYSDSVSL
jgi:hypothetical protein